MNLADKLTYIHFAISQLVHIFGEGGDHIAAHRDLDVAVIFGSNGFHFLAICWEQDIQYELLILLHHDTLHLLLGERSLQLLTDYCRFFQFLLVIFEVNIWPLIICFHISILLSTMQIAVIMHHFFTTFTSLAKSWTYFIIFVGHNRHWSHSFFSKEGSMRRWLCHIYM